MGARGPLKAEATGLRLVRPDGAAKAAAETTGATVIKPQRPDLPSDLPKRLHPLWDDIVGSLDDAGMIARCDGPALALALRHYDAAVRASNALGNSAVVQEDKKNQRSMKNPASQVFRDHSTAFLEFAKQLGLTFVARARTPINEPEGTNDNPFAGPTG